MNKRLAKILFYIYLIGVGVYAFYGTYSQTGLPGYFIQLQMQWMDRASMKLTAALTMLVLCLPLYPLAAYLRKIGVFGKNERIVGLDPQLRTAGTGKSVSLRMILIAAVIPALIAVPVYFYVKWQSDADLQGHIEFADLAGAAATPPPEAKFVELKAAMQMAHRLQVRETRGYDSGTRHTYAPLTPVTWRKDQPVAYFINTTIDEGWKLKLSNPPDTPSKFLLDSFQGKLAKDALPKFVREAFEKEGISIAAPHYVLDRMVFTDGKIPDMAAQQQYHLIWIIGLLLSGAILLGGLLGLLIRKMRGR